MGVIELWVGSAYSTSGPSCGCHRTWLRRVGRSLIRMGDIASGNGPWRRYLPLETAPSKTRKSRRNMRIGHRRLLFKLRDSLTSSTPSLSPSLRVVRPIQTPTPPVGKSNEKDRVVGCLGKQFSIKFDGRAQAMTTLKPARFFSVVGYRRLEPGSAPSAQCSLISGSQHA